LKARDENATERAEAHRSMGPGLIYCTHYTYRFGVLTVPLPVSVGAPTLFLRRAAYEASGLTRATIDERLGLTADEFRVEADLVAIGPIYEGRSDDLSDFIAELEGAGLVYFDDFFELSGNWPAWLRLSVSTR
jgi:hypothetical protein